MIAGLCADGVTEITDVEFIERGYENIVYKFKGLGANITKISEEPDKQISEIKAV